MLILAGAMHAAVAQTPRWVITNRWEGSGSCQTDKFWVNGAKWRIRYEPAGTGIFQISVYNTENQLVDVATNQNRHVPLNGYATLKGIGERHLGITGVDTTWKVTVEQYLTAIEEWHLRQLLKQPKPKRLKVGVWTGEGGQTQYTFTVPSDSWQIRYSRSGDGLFQIVVENDGGFVALAANDLKEGEGHSWVHNAGTFTMNVTAEDVSWKVEVVAEEAPGGG